MSFISNLHKRLDSLIPLSKRSKNISFTLLLLAASLDNINVSGTLSVYATIQEHFNADSPTVTWVLSAYALTLGAFIMLGGKMTDILGPKRVFLTGLIGSSLMCLICAAIEDQVIVLIVFRAFQGMFAALTIPSVSPIAFHYYSGPDFGTALSALIVVFTASSGAGLVIGGAFDLTELGYKSLYYFSSAAGLVFAITLYLAMYPVETQNENKNGSLRNLDLPGTFMIVVGILLIILGLTEGGESWNRPSAYVPIPVGVLVLIAGGWFELVYIQNYKDTVDAKRAESLTNFTKKTECSEATVEKDWKYDLLILIPRESFKVTNFIPFIISVTICYLCLISIMTLTVQYSQIIEGDSSLLAGLKALPFTMGLTSGVFINREKLIYRISMKWVITASQAASVLLYLWMSYHNYHVKNNYWIFTFVPLYISGILCNTFFGVYFNAILRNTPKHLQGVVSGLLQTLAQVGICLGNALMTTLLGVMTPVVSESQKDNYNKKFKRCYYVLIGALAAQVLVMLFLRDQKSVEMESDSDKDTQSTTLTTSEV